MLNLSFMFNQLKELIVIVTVTRRNVLAVVYALTVNTIPKVNIVINAMMDLKAMQNHLKDATEVIIIKFTSL